jgi:hypothetical protein
MAAGLIERERGEREGYLRPEISPLQAAAFRRGELRARADLAWHEEWDTFFAPAPGAQA